MKSLCFEGKLFFMACRCSSKSSWSTRGIWRQKEQRCASLAAADWRRWSPSGVRDRNHYITAINM